MREMPKLQEDQDQGQGLYCLHQRGFLHDNVQARFTNSNHERSMNFMLFKPVQ